MNLLKNPRREIVRVADCSRDIPSAEYRARISTQKHTSERMFTVVVDVEESSEAQLLIPSEVSKPGVNNKLVQHFECFLSPFMFYLISNIGH